MVVTGLQGNTRHRGDRACAYFMKNNTIADPNQARLHLFPRRLPPSLEELSARLRESYLKLQKIGLKLLVAVALCSDGSFEGPSGEMELRSQSQRSW
jgi:hypothetical protein